MIIIPPHNFSVSTLACCIFSFSRGALGLKIAPKKKEKEGERAQIGQIMSLSAPFSLSCFLGSKKWVFARFFWARHYFTLQIIEIQEVEGFFVIFKD